MYLIQMKTAVIVGLRQIHFLSEYWAIKQDVTVKAPVAKSIPLLSANA